MNIVNRIDASDSTRMIITYLAVLATLYTIYLAKGVLLPITLAAFVSLVSSPLVSRIESIGVRRAVGSILVLGAIIIALSAVTYVFTNPVQQWLAILPELASSMSDSLGEASESLMTQNGVKSLTFQDMQNVELAGKEIRNTTFMTLFKSFASMTPTFVTQVMATIFLIYFFLVYGQLLLLKILQSHSSFARKRLTIELVREVQAELSNYIRTITLINVALGLVVGTMFYFLGVEDAFLWGALAGVLNFAPYIGPLVSAFAFALVTHIQFGELAYTFMVPGLYLSINLIESQFVTPSLLGRNLDLSPLVVFVWLLLWGWLWGGLGLLLGLPLLVSLSIYLEKTELLGDWHYILRHRATKVADSP